MATPPLYILVRLWIHRGLETEFEAYERKVSRIMVRYGGDSFPNLFRSAKGCIVIDDSRIRAGPDISDHRA